MKNVMSDGWHYTREGFRYYVEAGRIVRGVTSKEMTCYPYRWDAKYNCYTSVSPIATYSNLRRLTWM